MIRHLLLIMYVDGCGLRTGGMIRHLLLALGVDGCGLRTGEGGRRRCPVACCCRPLQARHQLCKHAPRHPPRHGPGPEGGVRVWMEVVGASVTLVVLRLPSTSTSTRLSGGGRSCCCHVGQLLKLLCDLFQCPVDLEVL